MIAPEVELGSPVLLLCCCRALLVPFVCMSIVSLVLEKGVYKEGDNTGGRDDFLTQNEFLPKKKYAAYEN